MSRRGVWALVRNPDGQSRATPSVPSSGFARTSNVHSAFISRHPPVRAGLTGLRPHHDRRAAPMMRLTLTLQGPPRLMGATRSRSLSGGSLLIGRSPVCGWVLPDPDRVVSGRHCRIDSETDRFVLTDMSTNGVFLGEASEPLGFGVTAELTDGQVLRLGDARILVQVSAPSEPVPIAAPAAVPEGVIADDWFAPSGDAGSFSAAAPAIPDFDDLFAEELAAPGAAVAGMPIPHVTEPPPGLAFLADAASGRDVLAALDEVIARWEPEPAARLREEMAAVLLMRLGSREAGNVREAGGA